MLGLLSLVHLHASQTYEPPSGMIYQLKPAASSLSGTTVVVKVMPNLSTFNRLNASQINSNLIRTISSADVTLFSGSSVRILE